MTPTILTKSRIAELQELARGAGLGVETAAELFAEITRLDELLTKRSHQLGESERRAGLLRVEHCTLADDVERLHNRLTDACPNCDRSREEMIVDSDGEYCERECIGCERDAWRKKAETLQGLGAGI